MIDIYIFRIIIGKFSHREESNLVILLIVDKSLKIGLYYIVLYLGLAIYLWIKVGHELLIDIKEIT